MILVGADGISNVGIGKMLSHSESHQVMGSSNSLVLMCAVETSKHSVFICWHALIQTIEVIGPNHQRDSLFPHPPA